MPTAAYAATPSAITFSAHATGASTATVEGEVNPAGESTQYHVAYDLGSSEWCTSHGSKGSPGHSTSPVTLGSTAAKFHRVGVGLSGLTAGSEYCAEIVAVNGSGTAHSSQVSFTAGAPTARTFSGSPTGATSQLVQGEVNPAGQSTQYHVAYDLASSEWCASHGSKGSPGHSTSPVTLGSTAATFHGVAVGLSGLTAGSEYCAEIVAVNGSGTAHSGFQPTFIAGAPSAFAFSGSPTGATSELVQGEVNPAGQSTQYHVAYDLASSEWCASHGSKGSPGHSTSPVTLGSTAAKFHRVAVGLSGLTAGSEYCAEIVAVNGTGTAHSGFQPTFIAGAPSAFVLSPLATSATSELVQGEVNPAGESTQYHVVYDLGSSEWCTSHGSKGSPGHSTSPVTLGSTAAKFHRVGVGLSGLTAGSEYCAEIVAVNGSGTAHSGFQPTFIAGAPSAFVLSPLATSATSELVQGEVNPAGQSTEYHVAYDLASSEWCASGGLAGSPGHSTSPVTLGSTAAKFHRVAVGLSGLTAGSEYCAEVIAVDGSGSSSGFQQSFTAGAPSAFVVPPRATGATTATVEGQVNPAGQTTQYHVAYDLASSEWCASGGLAGSPAHSTTPVTLEFTDATSHAVSVELSGLTAGSEYCAEIIAVNGSGSSSGFRQSFTAGAPSAFTFHGSVTGATTATVEGQVNPAGQTTQYHVAYDVASSEWCASGGLAGSPAHSTTPVTLGFTDATSHAVSVELSGLTAGSEYCAEIVAVNGSGTAHSGFQPTFIAGAPSAFTFHGSVTGATTATVEGQVNPAGQTTQYHVAYDVASSEWCASGGLAGSPAHSTTPVTLGFTDATSHAVSVELSGLTAGSEYCAEIVAVNGSGTAHSSQVSFTAGAPTARTFSGSPTGATSQLVQGEVNPAGQTTQYHVAYDLASSEWCASGGLAGSPAHSTTPVTLGFTDATSHSVSVELSGLTAGSEYCAEIVAVNGSGKALGFTVFFSAGLPEVVTSKAVLTGATTATVEGQVNPAGQTTQYHVAYDLASSEWCASGGLAGSPAHSTTPVTLGFTDATSHAVSVELSGLTAGSEYCAEVIAVNGSGKTLGFPLPITAAPPEPTVTKVSPTSGTIAGGTAVTISGTNLAGAMAVHFGAASATVKTDTETEITVESPAHAAGQVDVTVTTPSGTSATSQLDHFTYEAPPAGGGGGGTAAGGGTASGGVLAFHSASGGPVAPLLGSRQTVAVVTGTVSVRPKGSSAFVALSGATSLPDESEVDATNGRIVITVATPSGQTVSAEVYGGRFRVHQDRTGETHFTLTLPLTGCPRVALPRGSAASTAYGAKHRSGPTSRHLWVSETGGRWATNGRFVSTSVQGTRWLTLDECTQSQVTVAAGKVRVLDLVRKKTRTVLAGQRYTASAKRHH